MAVKITSDSTCDLGELVEKYGIGIMPLNVILDTETYHDGVSITPKDIFSFVKKNNMLPKTSARSIIDYEEFFAEQLKGADELVHFICRDKLLAGRMFYSNNVKPTFTLRIKKQEDILATVKEIIELFTSFAENLNKTM